MAANTCSAQSSLTRLPIQVAADARSRPVALAPAFWAQVGGGAPKGGWLTQESFASVEKTSAPKGGW